jgi:hypothetical protein
MTKGFAAWKEDLFATADEALPAFPLAGPVVTGWQPSPTRPCPDHAVSGHQGVNVDSTVKDVIMEGKLPRYAMPRSYAMLSPHP